MELPCHFDCTTCDMSSLAEHFLWCSCCYAREACCLPPLLCIIKGIEAWSGHNMSMQLTRSFHQHVHVKLQISPVCSSSSRKDMQMLWAATHCCISHGSMDQVTTCLFRLSTACTKEHHWLLHLYQVVPDPSIGQGVAAGVAATDKKSIQRSKQPGLQWSWNRSYS